MRTHIADHPLIAAKLWENPCWFSFRINYLSLRFNGPVYGRIADRHDLSRPEYLVLYSLSLRDGIAAQDICETAGFPKNTISRAIHKLVRRKLIRRALDSNDRRSFVLHLTAEARRILAESVPPMVGQCFTTANTMPGSVMSMPYFALPLTFEGRSGRNTGWPMT